MTGALGRRDVIRLLGSAVAALPLTARAQQPTMPVIGFLASRSPGDSADLVAAFRRGLLETGYVEGQTVAIEYRWAEGHYERLPALAADLVARQVAIIAAMGGLPATLAAKAATATIPIVFQTGADPVEFGLVTSFSRPGGNLTGVVTVSNALVTKQLELLHELAPKADLVAFLANPKNLLARSDTAAIEVAARAAGREVLVLSASNTGELAGAFATLVERRAGAVLVESDPFLNSQPAKLAELAAHHAVPALYQFRDFPAAGGLMSYGSDLADTYRQTGVYVGRILKGEKPGNLPVVQSTKFKLIINLKTAKTLGLTVPLSVLATADEVIE